MSLNPKQKTFCAEYLIDLNGTQAAIRAGYSKKTARFIATENLTKPNIQEEIQKLMKERAKRTEITQDRVLEEMAILGYSNIKDYIAASTEGFMVFKDMDKITDKEARAIESIKVNVKEGKVEFKLHNKPKSIEMIGRHLGMFVEKVEHSGTIRANLSITDLKKSIESYENGNDKQ